MAEEGKHFSPSALLLLLLLLLFTFSLILKKKKKTFLFLLTLTLFSLGNDISARRRKRGSLFCYRQGVQQSIRDTHLGSEQDGSRRVKNKSHPDRVDRRSVIEKGNCTGEVSNTGENVAYVGTFRYSGSSQLGHRVGRSLEWNGTDRGAEGTTAVVSTRQPNSSKYFLCINLVLKINSIL